ncbi:unnamed protein product, partial [Ixodes pacificus]
GSFCQRPLQLLGLTLSVLRRVTIRKPTSEVGSMASLRKASAITITTLGRLALSAPSSATWLLQATIEHSVCLKLLLLLPLPISFSLFSSQTSLRMYYTKNNLYNEKLVVILLFPGAHPFH